MVPDGSRLHGPNGEDPAHRVNGVDVAILPWALMSVCDGTKGLEVRKRSEFAISCLGEALCNAELCPHCEEGHKRHGPRCNTSLQPFGLEMCCLQHGAVYSDQPEPSDFKRFEPHEWYGDHLGLGAGNWSGCWLGRSMLGLRYVPPSLRKP